MSELVYKVLRAAEWEAARSRGAFSGSADDARDGFIHLSTREQIDRTLRGHFAGEDGLILLEVRADTLASGLKWEPSRGGALFPHLYGELPLHSVDRVFTIALAPSGTHVLPPDL